MFPLIKKLLRPGLLWYAKKLNKDAERVFWMVMELTLTHRLLLTLLLVINVFAAVFESSSVGLLAIAVEHVTVGSSSGSSELLNSLGPIGAWLNSLAAGMSHSGFFILLISIAVGGQVMRAVIQYAGVLVSAEITTRVVKELQNTIVHRMMQWSFPQINRYKRGELTAFVRQTTNIAGLVGVLNGLASHSLILFGYLVVMFWVSWEMTLIGILAVTVFSIGISFIFRELKQIGARSVRSALDAGHDAMELFQAPKLLRVYNKEKYAEDRMLDALTRLLIARKERMIWSGMVSPLSDIFTIVAAAGVLVGGYFLLNNENGTALPTLLAFVFVMHRTMGKISFINSSRSSIANALPGAQLVSSTMSVANKSFTRIEGEDVPAFSDCIEFDKVSFTYPNTTTRVLDELSFRINKGEMVAFVGSSGAGKSTIADLILGLYDPSSGAVRMDGVDVTHAKASSWRDHFGVVSQESFLFNATVRENIAFGSPDAGPEEVVQAAKIANAAEFIEKLENGYDTNIGDQGYRLSGGQVQRLALARAALNNPDILLLDEATSSLDTISERRIVQAIDAMKGATTMIIIAHRLSTIMNADRILVLDKGQLTEDGSHAELLEADGVYARLWKMQTSRDER